MSFLIEKGIPRTGKVEGLTAALDGMAIGDSFELPPGGAKIATAGMASCAVGKATGKKFSWRKNRVWRIK